MKATFYQYRGQSQPQISCLRSQEKQRRSGVENVSGTRGEICNAHACIRWPITVWSRFWGLLCVVFWTGNILIGVDPLFKQIFLRAAIRYIACLFCLSQRIQACALQISLLLSGAKVEEWIVPFSIVHSYSELILQIAFSRITHSIQISCDLRRKIENGKLAQMFFRMFQMLYLTLYSNPKLHYSREMLLSMIIPKGTSLFRYSRKTN